jgi:putative ABC transport system ATP-binding protein
MLELERVVKRYDAASEPVRAVDGVTLSLRAGEMLALQGPSGSGKTTLLLLIAGLIKADKGTVRFRGRDVGRFSGDQLAEYLQRDVGFIYQAFHLMPQVSVIENAAMKLVLAGIGMREAKDRAFPWVERVGLADRLEHTTEQLSGGERQRVAIARALTGEPSLILADEPTGNLDSARSSEVIALLHSLARERAAAVLLVTHDGEAAGQADRCLLLRDGKLLAPEVDGRTDASRAIGAGGSQCS